MLARTANGLFWMARYLERAETSGRLTGTAHRIALTKLKDQELHWLSAMKSAGVDQEFLSSGSVITKQNAIDWLLRSSLNPSSALTSLTHARNNARLVRTAITSEVWETLNRAYLESSSALKRKIPERDLPDILNLIGEQIRSVHGALESTMLRNEILNFIRLGIFLERGDSTARILDVKYYVLLPSLGALGSPIDNLQWEIILRSTSGIGGFRMSYGNRADPSQIAKFLILDPRMPRSLIFCISKLRENLEFLSLSHQTTSLALSQVKTLEGEYKKINIDHVFKRGLHEFIQDLIYQLGQISNQIEADFNFHT